MNICSKCVHYRRVKPASQLLAKAVEMTDASISSALTKINEDEQKLRDSEAEFKKSQGSTDHYEWGVRPLMSNFCGLQENDSIYLIAEIKNHNGQCTDFKQGRLERRSCDDCAHRIVPEGEANDRKMQEAYAQMGIEGRIVGLESSGPDSLLNKYREGIGPRIAFEIAGAYHAQGILAMKPNYLDYCEEFSTDDEHIIAILRNPYHTCQAWESAGNDVASTTLLSKKSVTAPESATPIAAVFDIMSNTFQPPSIDSSSIPIFDPQEHQNDETLIDGQPPLTQRMVDQMAKFWEWALDIHLSEEQYQLLYIDSIQTWNQPNKGGIENFLSVLTSYKEIEEADPAARDFHRENYQPDLEKSLRRAHSALKQSLLKSYLVANKPLTSTDPPLTREMTNSFLEFSFFIYAMKHGTNYIPPTQEIRNLGESRIMIWFSSVKPEERDIFTEMPLYWASTRAVWDQLPKDEKERRVEKYSSLLPFVESLLDERLGTQRPPLRTKEAVSEPKKIGSILINPSDDDLVQMLRPLARMVGAVSEPKTKESSIADNLREIEELYRKEEEEAARQSPAMALATKLQHQQEMAQMMSNMSKTMHEMNMGIIKNIE